jgi:hypothetical protein
MEILGKTNTHLIISHHGEVTKLSLMKLALFEKLMNEGYKLTTIKKRGGGYNKLLIKDGSTKDSSGR